MDCTCDFSNSHMPDGYFHRCELVNCKCMGVDLYKSSMQEMNFASCNFQYANCDGSTLKNVQYADCDLQRSVLSECTFKSVAFDNCRIVGTNFFKTRLKGIDLSTCQVEGVIVSDTYAELRGLKIAPVQTAELVNLLGVEIVDK